MRPLATPTALMIATLCSAASPPEALSRNLPALLSAHSLKCTFGPGTGATWPGGKISLRPTAYDMTTHFDSIDLKGGTARVIGNAGSSDVLARVTGDAGIYFLEETRLGGLAVTFVYPLLDRDRKFVAVMSRRMDALDRPIPSQGYGYCEIWQ